MNIKRIILWLAFWGIFATMVSSFAISPEYGLSEDLIKVMTSQDIVLFRASAIIAFGIILIGLFVELDLFDWKKNIPLLKSGKLYQHILFWVILILIMIIVLNIIQYFMSDGYKDAIQIKCLITLF